MADHDVEPWLRGPMAGIPPLLQPVAHALQHAIEDVRTAVTPLTAEQAWRRPVGTAAAVGFHVRHAAGALDRLLTYARGEALSDEQRRTLASEAEPDLPLPAGAALVTAFEAQVARALAQVAATSEQQLLEARGVGRAMLPSTVLGLLFHAAEHTQRHVGQIVTTVRIVTASRSDG